MLPHQFEIHPFVLLICPRLGGINHFYLGYANNKNKIEQFSSIIQGKIELPKNMSILLGYLNHSIHINEYIFRHILSLRKII